MVVQGFGNVGTHAALYAHQRGAKVLAVSDVSGGIYNENGLDIPELLRYVAEHKVIKGYPKASADFERGIAHFEMRCPRTLCDGKRHHDCQRPQNQRENYR